MAWEWKMIEEEKALRALRKVVDGSAKKLRAPGIDETEATRVLELTRVWVSKVFPDKLPAYDAIYKPKLEKIYSKSGGART
jgi:hypothetical protein